MGSRNRADSSRYRNPCLTMHQPWASLLVYGIKRIEGRSWPSPVRACKILAIRISVKGKNVFINHIRKFKLDVLWTHATTHLSKAAFLEHIKIGRLWIHAAGKVPEPETIKAMEDFYREIYAMDGITDIKFPEHYPVSRLIGCVEVVGCVTCEELNSWKAIDEGVRVEGQTPFCWLCEKPQKLVVPFEMRGNQGVYNLDRKIYEAAARGLSPVEPPVRITFPLPNPQNPNSLKPGSLTSCSNNDSSASQPEKPTRLVEAIAGARAAATQFSKPNIPGGNTVERVMWKPIHRQ